VVINGFTGAIAGQYPKSWVKITFLVLFILLLAGGQGTVASGALLLFLYSLGLGVPFLLAALFLDRFQSVSAWLRRGAPVINATGGVLLVAMGSLVFLGQLTQVLSPALELYARLKWPPL